MTLVSLGSSEFTMMRRVSVESSDSLAPFHPSDHGSVLEDHEEQEEDYFRSTHRQRKKSGPRKSFPRKLHALLDAVETNEYSRIISWQPHGRSFKVHEPRAFVHHIMPEKFRQTKWSSFQRQLNLYGFVRCTSGPDKGSYYHASFLRGKPNLCDSMVRMKVKGTGVRQATKGQVEPNFYAMPLLDEMAAYAGANYHSNQLYHKEKVSVRHDRIYQDIPEVKDAGTLDMHRDIVPEDHQQRHHHGTCKQPPEDSMPKLPDDPHQLQDMFAMLGKPFSLDGLDELPQDDIDSILE